MEVGIIDEQEFSKYQAIKRVFEEGKKSLKDGIIYHNITTTNCYLVEDLLEDIYKEKAVAIDIETSGLNPESEDIVGVSFCANDTTAYYFPCAHKSIFTNSLLPHQEPRLVNKILHFCLEEAATKVFHYGKFDCGFFNAHSEVFNRGLDGEPIYPDWDTCLFSRYFEKNEKNSLGICIEREGIGVGGCKMKFDFNDLPFKKAFQYVPAHLAHIYGAGDALDTWNLYKVQKTKAPADFNQKEFFAPYINLSYKEVHNG